MFVKHNENPRQNRVIDCTVRAIAVALNQSWDRTYLDICDEGFRRKNMPSANDVWGAYIYNRGFRRRLAPIGITVAQFARENPLGVYILAADAHVIALIDGDWLDTYDSGDETVIYYWER